VISVETSLIKMREDRQEVKTRGPNLCITVQGCPLFSLSNRVSNETEGIQNERHRAFLPNLCSNSLPSTLLSFRDWALAPELICMAANSSIIERINDIFVSLFCKKLFHFHV
jgi:hypothetical protein